MSQDNREGFRKQTIYWMNPNTDSSRPKNSSDSSASVASSSKLRVDKGKGKELAPSLEIRSYAAEDIKGKAKEVNPMFELGIPGHSLADEEIFSPGAVAQRKLAGFRNMAPLQGDIFGGAGGNGHLNGSSGIYNSRDSDIGGRTLGGLGASGVVMGGLGVGGGGMDNLGSNVHLDDVRSLRDTGSLGGTEGLSGSLARLGQYFLEQGDGYGAGGHIHNVNKDGGSGAHGEASSSPPSTARTGTWSGTGIQSRLSDEGA
jgi:hypothetical protein